MSGINKLRAGIKRKSNAVRAKATNGTIKITYRLKKGDVDLPDGVKNSRSKFDAWCVKRGLWKVGDDYTMKFQHGHFLGNGVKFDPSVRKYPMVLASGGPTGERIDYRPNVQFIGLVESGRMEGNVITLHVSVRGVIHVPRWWFTTMELRMCHHSILGRTYTKRQDDVDHVTNSLKEVETNHNDPDFPGRNRHVGKLITVYFRT